MKPSNKFCKRCNDLYPITELIGEYCEKCYNKILYEKENKQCACGEKINVPYSNLCIKCVMQKNRDMIHEINHLKRLVRQFKELKCIK